MNKRIIFQNDQGGISIIIPSPQIVAVYGIAAVAAKDVPAGKPYRIIDADDIPADRTFRAAWEADFSDFDGIGTESITFPVVDAESVESEE